MSHSEQHRASVVRSYLEAREKGESQVAWCKRTGVPARTLRAWLGRYGPLTDSENRHSDVLRARLREAIAHLQALLAVMEPVPRDDSSSPRRDVDEERTTEVVPPAPETGSGMETASSTSSASAMTPALSTFMWDDDVI